MSLTSGFFNSLNGDRRYNAEQMSEIFNGIINDGVFASIGSAFAVKADTGNNITVGVGRAWFNGKWIYNDSIMPLRAPEPEVALNRYDAVVLEIDNSEDVRDVFIKVVKGVAASDPDKPTMIRNEYVNQYPLAYIYRKSSTTEILQSNITNAVGTSSCPFVTGILRVLAIDTIVAQWEAQWVRLFADLESENGERMDQLIYEKQTEFNTWFNNLRVVLDGDVATNLASELLELRARVDALDEAHYPAVEDSDGNSVEDNNGDNISGELLYELKTI